MKDIAINGSPRANGNTAAALKVLTNELERQGIETETIHVGHREIHGCIACGHCWYCRNNQKLFCPEVRQLVVHDHGGMADYVVVPARNIYILPPTMAFDHAAFI